MQEKDTSTEERRKAHQNQKTHKKTNRIVYQSGITSKDHYAAVQIIVFRR